MERLELIQLFGRMPTTDGEEIPVGAFKWRADSICGVGAKKLFWEPLSTVLVAICPLAILAVTEYLDSLVSIICSSGDAGDVYLN